MRGRQIDKGLVSYGIGQSLVQLRFRLISSKCIEDSLNDGDRVYKAAGHARASGAKSGFVILGGRGWRGEKSGLTRL
jgi:hypothetical protein